MDHMSRSRSESLLFTIYCTSSLLRSASLHILLLHGYKTGSWTDFPVLNRRRKTWHNQQPGPQGQ
jgi:hypothetical protein